jgi:hypothetical protein
MSSVMDISGKFDVEAPGPSLETSLLSSAFHQYPPERTAPEPSDPSQTANPTGPSLNTKLEYVDNVELDEETIIVLDEKGMSILEDVGVPEIVESSKSSEMRGLVSVLGSSSFTHEDRSNRVARTVRIYLIKPQINDCWLVRIIASI